MLGAFSGFIGFGLAVALAGCLVVTFAGGLVGDGPDPEAGLLRPSGDRFGLGRGPTAEGHAVPACLHFGRPRGLHRPCRRRRLGRCPTGTRRLRLGLVDGVGRCQGQVVPTGRPVLGFLVGVHLAAISSKGFGVAVVALAAASRPVLALCRPDADWVALDLPAGSLGVLAGVAVVAVGRGRAMLGTPMPASRQACRTAIAVGDHGQPTTPLACPRCTFNVPSRCAFCGQASGWSLVQAVVASSSTSASERTRS
jgi:hypothetical protein